MGGIASVGEIDADLLRLAGNQTVRHGVQTVETHIVLVNIRVVVVSHQESVETVLAAVDILHVDVVVDGVGIADGGQLPLGIDGVDNVVAGVGVDGGADIVGESVGVGNDNRRTTVDLIAEHDGVEVHRVVVGELALDGEGSELIHKIVIRRIVAHVVIERGHHEDARRDKLAVGKAQANVVEEPARALLRTRSTWGRLVQTVLETEVCGSGGTRLHKDGP